MSRNILLIIGASSDIGLDLIKSVDEDCLILAHYNSSGARIHELSKETSNELVALKADLNSDKELAEFLDNIESNYGLPQKIVFLAAAPVENIRFKAVRWRDFENNINISLKASVTILSRFLPELAKQKSGKIVFMLSSYVLGVPPKALSHYTTIKYALLGLTKSLASEYADKNIQINAVSPSMIETRFLNNINEKFVELNAYSHPLKRNAVVGDVTPVIRMLLSEDSDYMNGVNIPITGGGVF
ncbi:MAG: SDR family oxidoreductase [Robiginitomaculum sp.]|nr:MAG: SDR family oxidoreductase [Robiginitomaculum sp.]